MEKADWDLSDKTLNTALGSEVRRLREKAGLTRPDLAALLPFDLSVAALLNWELGERSISYVRLIWLGRILGVSAPELLRRAIERIEVTNADLVQLDLEPVANNKEKGFYLLGKWARNKLAQTERETSIVRLHHSVIRELAIMLDVELTDLVEFLTSKASLRPVPANGEVAETP